MTRRSACTIPVPRPALLALPLLAALLAAPAPAPAQPGPKVHPDVQRNLSSAVRALDQADGLVAQVDAASAAADKDALLKRLAFQVEKAETDLKAAEESATGRGQAGHPALQQARARLAALAPRVAQAKEGAGKAAAGEKAAVAGAAASAKALKAEYDRLYEKVFSKANGYPFHYNDAEPVQEAIEAIESYEKDDMPGLKERLARFEREVGTSKDAIDAKAEADGYDDPYYRPSWAWEKLKECIGLVAQTRKAMGEDLLKRADHTKGNVKNFTADFSRVERYEEVLSWLQLAARFDPENARAQADLQSFPAWRDADWKEFGRQIDGRKFPGPVQGAPGNAAALAAAGKQWFAQSDEWGRRDQNPRAKDKAPRRVVTVVVTGPWSVQATNILGKPTMYGVPAKLVVALDREKDLDVYRVYDLTLRTAEHEGVKAAPPFDSVTVGNSGYVRPAAVKGR